MSGVNLTVILFILVFSLLLWIIKKILFEIQPSVWVIEIGTKHFLP